MGQGLEPPPNPTPRYWNTQSLPTDGLFLMPVTRCSGLGRTSLHVAPGTPTGYAGRGKPHPGFPRGLKRIVALWYYTGRSKMPFLRHAHPVKQNPIVPCRLPASRRVWGTIYRAFFLEEYQGS